MKSGIKGASPSFGDALSLIKPGIVLSNTFTAGAAWVLAASGDLLRKGIADRAAALLATLNPLPSLGLALAGTALLVGGSCAVNNWIDRDIDAMMERTRQRPAARGRVGRVMALGLGFGLIGAGSILLLLIGPITALIGLSGSLIYLLPYTLWAKRRGSWSSLIGGISGAVPPLIGWSAFDPGLGGPAILLFVLLVAWQQAHVRALALKRQGEYRDAQVPMAGLGAAADRAGLNPYPLSRRSRYGLLAWTVILLAFPPALGIRFSGLPGSIFTAFEEAFCLAWILYGLVTSRKAVKVDGRMWGRGMFLASLAWLVAFFSGLVAATIADALLR